MNSAVKLSNHKQTTMISTTSRLKQAKAVADIQISTWKIAARFLVILVVIYYGTLLDVLSGTMQD
jgi:hypothetical protein